MYLLLNIEYEKTLKKIREKYEENLRKIWRNAKGVKFQDQNLKKLMKTEKKFEEKLKEISIIDIFYFSHLSLRVF